MGNLTESFVQLVEILEKKSNIQPIIEHHEPLIRDTFVKESFDLLTHILELKKFLKSIEKEYLLADTGRYNQFKSNDTLTEEERDEIDTRSRLELKKYNERLKYLDSYESKRVESKQFFRFDKSQSSVLNKHREGILLSLSNELRITSRLLLSMQETRLSRKRDIELGQSDNTRFTTSSIAKYDSFLEQQDLNPNTNLDELTNEQILLLKSENSEILDAKLEDLIKVEQIHKSVVEIAQLESQLSSHLTVQSEHINSLVNDHDITHGDIVEGNKLLKKAKSKGNYASKIVTLIALLLSFIILFFDYIKF